jgi:hypothetical protein
VTPTVTADLALADAYRDWFRLCAEERRGVVPHIEEVRAVVQAIRDAARLSTHPRLVYEVTKGKWWVDTGEAP